MLEFLEDIGQPYSFRRHIHFQELLIFPIDLPVIP